MAKAKRNVGREILDGLREIKRGEYGRVINVPDAAKIREKTGLSQSRFASLLGVSVRTFQDWEQGHGRRRELRARCCSWPTRIRERCSTLPRLRAGTENSKGRRINRKVPTF